MKATEDLDIGFTQIGMVIKKKVSFATVENKPDNRFTLHPNKLYLDSCATYHSTFVRDMLSNVKTGTTVLQGQCNAGLSTSAEKGVYRLWTFWLNEKGIVNLSLFLVTHHGFT